MLIITLLGVPLAAIAVVLMLPGRLRYLSGTVVLAANAFALVGTVVLTLHHFPNTTTVSWEWFTIHHRTFTLLFSFDRYALVMLLLIFSVTLLVTWYSLSFMRNDPDQKRYYATLGFFAWSMSGLVACDDILLLFFFWEFIGFCSFRLISHWQATPQAAGAAVQAVLVNRIGDGALLIAVLLMTIQSGSSSLTDIAHSTPTGLLATLAGGCLLLGLAAKSAQFPLAHWLPDAMAGPTPISALMHAATMVTAGVFLLIRLYPLLPPTVLLALTAIGSVTAMGGGLGAFTSADLKKILAYSTLSHLGLMVIALGIGSPEGAFLHLVSHGTFKAGLFLVAGVLLLGAQPNPTWADLRLQMQANKRLLAPAICLLAALAGFPFFSSFLTKDFILAKALAYPALWPAIVVVSVIFLSTLYATRLFLLLCLPGPSWPQSKPDYRYQLPVVLLAGGSLWLCLSWHPLHLSGWSVTFAQPKGSLWAILLSLGFQVAALLLAWLLHKKNMTVSPILFTAPLVRLQTAAVLPATRALASFAALIDRHVLNVLLHALSIGYVSVAHMVGWLDRVLVDGTVRFVSRLFQFSGGLLRLMVGGQIQAYLTWSFILLLGLLIWFAF